VTAPDGGPVVRIEMSADHRPLAATATMRIGAPPARVWEVISDVSRYADRIPMMNRVQRDGDRVTVHLRFRISLFSVGFDFTADARYDEGRWLELTHVAGEPRGLHLRYELTPVDEGAATLVSSYVRFDVMSLGWLVKFFLRHHPEIQFGIFPGTSLVLLDAMRRACEKA
jgi:carbon monoxide dehydrogenase subunit G